VQVPLQISFKDGTRSLRLEQLINKKIAKLERICSYMISCRVTVEKPQAYPDTGNPYRVRIDIKVPPAHEIVVKQSASEGDMHDPLPTVITKVFHAAERRLKELTERQHGEVKTHPQQQVMGIVHRLFPDQDYGFIKTADTGEDVYFHRNSVLHRGFDRLTIGTGVRFVVEQGQKGLQASSVEIQFKSGPGFSTKTGS
jgi:cold shock CspA family protein/ribosome-associated translation inhibitor RaiA